MVDEYRLTVTMFKMTKGVLMAQSSKQTCIILVIVRILSPSNNTADNSSPGEKGCKRACGWRKWIQSVHLWWMCLCAITSQCFRSHTYFSQIKSSFKIVHPVCASGCMGLCVCVCVWLWCQLFLCACFRVNEAVYQWLAQLVGAGD